MIAINLLPKEMRRKSPGPAALGVGKLPLRQIAVFSGLGLLAVHGLVLLLFLWTQADAASLSGKWKRLAGSKQQVDALKAEVGRLQERVLAFETITTNRFLWSSKLRQLSDDPDGVRRAFLDEIVRRELYALAATTDGLDDVPAVEEQITARIIGELRKEMQREILEHEVPEVLTDAVDQSVEWGTRRRPEWYAFRRLFERFDVDRLAGAAVGHLAGRLYRRVPNLDRFFRDRYQVGSEDIARDIPPLILAQMLAQALLVFKNAVAGAVRHQRFARLLTPLKPIWSAAAWILWALYVVAIMVRRQSGVVTVLNTAITISSALLLWVGVRWRRDIWWTDDGLDLFWAAVFLLLPAVLLLAQAIYCRWWLQQRALLGAFFVISLLAGVGLVVYGATSGQYGFLHDWWARLLEGTRATFRSHEAAWFVWAPLGFLMVAWFARPAWFRR